MITLLTQNLSGPNHRISIDFSDTIITAFFYETVGYSPFLTMEMKKIYIKMHSGKNMMDVFKEILTEIESDTGIQLIEFNPQLN